jgi:transposase-like protein
MPQGRVTSICLVLRATERQRLHRWQHSTRLPAFQVRRARIILLVEGGYAISHVAREVGIARRHVYKWVRRFEAWGVDGLRDLPRRDTARGDDDG